MKASRPPTALPSLLEQLEARYAMRVLWALRDGQPQTFRVLQDSAGGVTPNTLNTRLKSLRSADLLEHNGSGYRLTALGQQLVRGMEVWQPLARRGQTLTVRETPGPSARPPRTVGRARGGPLKSRRDRSAQSGAVHPDPARPA